MRNRLNDERDNDPLLEPVGSNRYIRHQRRRLNTQSQPINPPHETNANPYRNTENASSSWNTALVLTRRLKHKTLEMLAIPGAVAPVLTRRLKPDCGGWAGNRRN